MTAALDRLFSLAGRRALVTGASRGIGRAIAAGLASAGATVIGCGRSAAPAPALPGVEYRRLDLADGPAVERFFETLPDLDVLVNAAGISLPPAAEGESEQDRFEATVSLDLTAVYRCCRLAAARMGEGGSIVNVTSIASLVGLPDNPGYVAAKGGLRQLGRALAIDLGPRGIRVNNLAPGYVRTAMTEKSYADPALNAQRCRHTALGRWGSPDDLVGAAVFLAGPASAYVTGIDLLVDGGWTAKGLT